MAKLDKKDQKILYLLDLDASQSSSKIAKRVGLSKDAVNYRINKLKEEGIIKHYYLVLNTPQLGYMHFNTLFRFNSLNKKIKEEFIKYCTKHKKVIWLVSCHGNWDFGVSILAKDLEEYNIFIQEILNKFGTNIHEKTMSLIIDSPTFSREYLIQGKIGKELKYKPSTKIKLDQKDKKILSLISQNANLNAIEISNKIKLTPDIVRYRIKQLKEKNIIQTTRVALDLEKIGYSYYKFLFTLKDFTPEKELEFKAYCKKHPNIIQFIKYIGNWEIQIELEVSSEKELYEILEELRTRFSTIIKTYEILKLKEYKLDYYPFSAKLSRDPSVSLGCGE